MNFFQSVFSDDPEPEPENSPEPSSPNPNTTTTTIPSITSAWTFGNTLLQTLASKSESVIETYRRDLQDFTSGIKSETAVIVNAVKDLPNSLEAGADLAQGSLESVGQAIDDLGLTVTSYLSITNDNNNHSANDSLDRGNYDSTSDSDRLGFPKAYSRLDAQIRAIRSDMKTYLDEPEDVEEFNEWKLGFNVDENVGEIEDVMKEDVGEVFREIVPVKVDEETFWRRYFYKVYKVKRAEEARVKLMSRAALGDGEEEELSWDVDEDEYEENADADLKVDEKEEKELVESTRKEVKEVAEEGGDNVEVKSDVKTGSEGKTDRDSDISIVSTQPSPEEDGWDEIEDIGSSDENKEKVVSRGSPDRAELRKRLSVAEDDEDLTWDIEDDDEEPVRT